MFIIRLSKVDCLTLSGILLISLSMGLMLHQRFAYALSLMFLALLVDGLDGLLARKLGLERDFGRYLDGFVDVLDYLVAPSLFLYLWGMDTWYDTLAINVFVMSGVVRLSVFNEIGNIRSETQELGYLGMPVFWSVLWLGVLYVLQFVLPMEVIHFLGLLMLVGSSFFMVYRRPFYKFKRLVTLLMVPISGSILFAVLGFIGK
ncbi:MAG: CDP-alcohol phosphatidyltransferase family protein [SAR324 cluster bacterium]|nr:CDP-alcohol phosphatidyltransferase family protein [SAR324 cluster bacterium]